MIKKLFITLVLTSLLSFTALFTGFKDLVLEKLSEYTANYPEKIYVQTDKPYYAIGEDLWFSAYLVNGINHRKSDKSRIIHVELINDKDSIVSHKQLYTNDISVAGDFKIEKDWNQGNYLLRAYTNYMRNKEQDYFFQKEIPIWNVSANDSVTKITEIDKDTSTPIDEGLTELPKLDFYPEGGYLINGIQSKIGIKVTDKKNRDIEIKGTIKDADDNSVCSFKSYKYGLGLVSFVPEPNKNYFASILINNQEATYPLPKALPNGYHLNIVNTGNQLILEVTSTSPMGLMNSFLVAHQRGKLIFEKLENKDINTYTLTISTATLQDGVANFTLFDNDGKPVCERLVYINNPTNAVDVTVTKNIDLPKTRDQITLEIDLKDEKGNNVSGNLSMSITDMNVVEQNSNRENIKTYLLLNSDLRGQIENPGYFFEKENDPKRRFLLDLVMLTHGWRRFTWNELIYNNTTTKDKYKAEKGLYISGYTTPLKQDGNRIAAETRLTFYGSLIQQKQRSKANGAFNYGPFVFHDTLPTILEARTHDFLNKDKKNRNVSIFLDNKNFIHPKITRNSVLKPNIDDTEKVTNFMNQSQSIAKIDGEYMENARLLDEVVIIAHKKSEKENRNEILNERTDYGSPSRRLDLSDMENADDLTITELLEMLPGVTVFNDTISIKTLGTPRLYLDKMPVEFSEISTVTGSEVEFIDLLRGADASFFSQSGNGVIIIHSKVGTNIRSRNVKRNPGIIDFTSIGFYTAREFYSPDHLNDFEEVLKQDVRNTLHWEPKITISDSINKANISFFTSDTRSKYAIEIEGITNSGIPVYHVSTFIVE